MKRDVIIALIAKDIKELEMLTEGFAEMQSYPAPYMKLAEEKARQLIENIKLLSQLPTETATPSPIINDTPPTPVATVNVTPVPEPTPESTIIKEEEIIDTEATPKHEEQPVVQEVEPTVEEVEEPIIEEEEEIVYDDDEEEDYYDEDEIEEECEEEEPAIVETDIVVETQEQTPEPEVVVKTPVSVADSIETKTSLIDTLNNNTEDKSIATSIAKKKINDIKTAITIADRFRFQRELFAGNGEKMMQTLTNINLISSLEMAQDYISKHFSWDPTNQSTIDFMDLVERRFL